jgi:hypothetical protein
MKIANTPINNATVNALKNISNFEWTGATVHNNLESCLIAINLQSSNSGHYKPVAARFNGVTGIYMINQSGSIFTEARVIKEDEKKYKIEYITMKGWNQLEQLIDSELTHS